MMIYPSVNLSVCRSPTSTLRFHSVEGTTVNLLLRTGVLSLRLTGARAIYLFRRALCIVVRMGSACLSYICGQSG